MTNAVILRLHRWLTLIFALPLMVVVVTGLILSFQPIVQTASIRPGSLTQERLEALVRQYDPDSKARGLSINPYDRVLSLDGVGPDGEIDVDLRTGAETEEDTPLSDFFSSNRRIHQRLILRMGWLVNASTAAMLVIIALGVLMGWPRLRNTLSGWHKGVAWFTLPLVVISPLTGLMLAFNINITPPPAGAPPQQQPAAANVEPRPAGRPERGARPPAVAMIEAVRMVAAAHDPATILSIGARGGRLLARVNDGGALRAYAVTPEGLRPQPPNWPRLIHEGNWMGYISGGVNVITSFAILGLLGTGLTIWVRRTFRRRRARADLPREPLAPSALGKT